MVIHSGKFKIGFVIPAYNEEATIYNVVKSVKEHGIVIVINDASSDRTNKVAESAGAIVVSHKENKGYDQAINSGFLKVEELNCDAVITFDADGQHDPRIIKEFIELLENGFRVVIGKRLRFQRISEYIFSWLASWKWGIKDPLCGVKAYHIDVYKQLGYFDSYKSIGTELAIYASQQNIKIAQRYIEIKNRKGKSRFGGKFAGNIAIFRSLWIGLRKY